MTDREKLCVAVNLLRALAWQGNKHDEIIPTCPSCNNCDFQGHHSTCALRAVLVDNVDVP